MRLIDADKLKKVFGYTDEWYKGRTVCEYIDNAPTVESNISETYGVAYEQGFRHGKEKYERPQGEWYYSCEKGWECSQCHEVVKEMPTVMRKANCNFCPNCGADMRGNEE